MSNKVSTLMAQAFENGFKLSMGNTCATGDRVLYLHGNAIAKFDDGQLYVNLSGWNTQTTKARLNALTGVSVHNVKGEPCLNGVPMPVNGWVKVPMESQFI